MKLLLVTLTLFASAVGLPAQTTWNVGDPGLPTIDAALAVAAPGDIIVVPTGFHDPFTVTKGVTIRSDGGFVQITNIGPPAPVVCDVPPGHELHFKWLSFVSTPIRVLGGRVSITTCNVSTNPGTPSLEVQNATVHLLGCDLTVRDAPALEATASDVTLAGCRFREEGGAPVVDGIVVVEQSRLHATGTRMMVPPTSAVGPAVSVRNGSTAWLSDCYMESHICAVENVASSIRTDRCTLVQSGASCSAGTPGPLLGVERVSTLVGYGPGGTWAPLFRYEPNSFVILFASPELDTVTWGPVLEQPTWLDHSQAFSAQVLFTGASGEVAASVAIPAGPGIANQRLWFVGIAGPGGPLQVSPALGGVL